MDQRRNTTGTVPIKKPPCFKELDEVLSDRPTTLPIFLQSSSGNASVDDASVSKNIDEDEEVPADFEVPNDDLIDDILMKVVNIT